MVTAGVFLLARFSPMFEMSGDVLTIVALVGGVTAVFAATIGLTQNDIKRVIAYSTCSQLGYMFFACGVSAYTAAIFHLMTHAFFKALLFLGAGSVIHGMHDEQDIRKMGGLMKLLPITYGLMLIGSLALAGIPPFAGFFSKDFILESALMSGGTLGTAMYTLGVVAALMTAFYSFRLMFMVFNGASRADKKVLQNAHESPWVMLAPMLVLCVGAVFAGWLGYSMTHTEWWHGAIVIDPAHVGTVMAHHTPAFYK
jgi:NADH-quinone oxidoreductase subunit L